MPWGPPRQADKCFGERDVMSVSPGPAARLWISSRRWKWIVWTFERSTNNVCKYCAWCQKWRLPLYNQLPFKATWGKKSFYLEWTTHTLTFWHSSTCLTHVSYSDLFWRNGRYRLPFTCVLNSLIFWAWLLAEVSKRITSITLLILQPGLCIIRCVFIERVRGDQGEGDKGRKETR